MLQVLRGLVLAAVTAGVTAFPLHHDSSAKPASMRVAAGYQSHVYVERQDQAGEAMVQAWNEQVNAALAEAERQRKAEAEAKAKAEAEARAAVAAAAIKVPAPAPAPAPAPVLNYGSGQVQDIIRKAFAPYGEAATQWGLRVASCESGFNPRAYNAAGPYYGLFQFALPTFKNTPYGNQDPFDPFYNASAAAWKYSITGGGAWGCK
jgi:hypothetical protein